MDKPRELDALLPPPPEPLTGNPSQRAGQVELILQQLETLPTLSPIAARVMNLASADDAELDKIITLLESDPALSARLLSLCRRATTGIAQPITTVRRAAAMLGLEAVQSAVLSVQIYEILKHDPHSREERAEWTDFHGFDRVGFWQHSLAVACCCELLADAHRELKVRPEEAFTAGLVHDLGKLALDWVLPRTYRQVIQLADARQTDIAAVERVVMGLDHHVAGKRLAEHWGLPHLLQDAIWLHGQTPAALPDVKHRGAVMLVMVADALCRRLHLGWSGNFSEPRALGSLCADAGLDVRRVDELTPRIHEALVERSKDLGLGETTSPELMAQSIAKANQRLSRLHELRQERTETSRLQTRVLEAQARFGAAAAQSDSVGSTLAAIARCVEDLAGAGFCAALHQTRPGEPWRLYRLGSGRHAEPSVELQAPRDARGQAMDLAMLGSGESLGGAIGLLTWLSEHLSSLSECPDLRSLRFVPLISGVGPAAVMLHDRELHDKSVTKAGLESLTAAWTSAVTASTQHEGAKRLAEALAETARVLADTQHRLTEAQSMARLGELTAGAAHELNNPLTVICGRAQLLAERLHSDRDRSDARQIADAASRLTSLVTNLHLVARPPKADKRPARLSDILTRAVQTAQQRTAVLRGPRAQVALTVHSAIGETLVDPDLMHRAVVELICNACEAGSTLVDVRAIVQAETEELVINVQDDGPGMSQLASSHAFDPFFSEKPAGRQPGLGLPIARGAVQAHGGDLRISSQSGQGTLAQIRLSKWRAPANMKQAA
ncbi:MAG: HDOD domain-containing protein [Phycisphaerales bacterium]